MSETPNFADSARTAEGLCGEALEDAWRSWRPGREPPRWPDFLPARGRPDAAEQAVYLIQTDLEFRARAGLPGLLGQPYFRHPRLVQAGVRLGAAQEVELIRWEYQQRWQNGARARAADYRVGFPEHAAALNDLRPRWTCPACRRPATAPDEEVPAPLRCPACGADVPAANVFRPRAAPDPAAAADTAAGFPSLPFLCSEQTAPGDTWAGPAAEPGPALPVVPGYEVLGELGRGGMGVVYQARQVGLNRPVALKMVLAGRLAGPAELARFRAEAEAVARCHHPHIVQIYEIGTHAGLPYFSLEYMAGGGLDRRLAGTPLPPAQAAALVETLARAMQAAHARGIIHRDLKPANILLSGDGVPKVTDFGLARRQDASVRQTQSGAILGTPCYMAPEQAMGTLEDIGPATDVYALGAVLYECLTGRPPFKAPTPLETLYQVVNDEPVPPRQLQPQAPRDLETICLKCLAKEPARRYTSAGELADDLRRFRAGEPIRARPVRLWERGWKWVRRRPLAAALAVALLLLVVLGTGAAWLLEQQRWERQAERARQRQEQEAERARQQADTGRAVGLAQGEARVLLAQARAGDMADLGRYREALAAARRADELARRGRSDESLRQQARRLVDEVAAELKAAERDRRLLDRLLDISNPRETPEFRRSESGLVSATAEADANFQYAEAFRAWGLDVDQVPTAEAARRLKARPDRVVLEAAAALDTWAAWRRRNRAANQEWRWLVPLARAIDPNPRRNELRTILDRGRLAPERRRGEIARALLPLTALSGLVPGEDRNRLRQMARDVDAALEPVLGVLLLAEALVEAGDRREAERVLRAALWARPGEILLLLALGRVLEGGPSPRWPEVVECYLAARALRPHSGRRLALVLEKARRFEDALGVWRQLLRQEPHNL